MKTLPLDDPRTARELAQAYAEAGVTHLIHTQGVRDEAAFSAMVDVLCGQIQPDLT